MLSSAFSAAFLCDLCGNRSPAESRQLLKRAQQPVENRPVKPITTGPRKDFHSFRFDLKRLELIASIHACDTLFE